MARAILAVELWDGRYEWCWGTVDGLPAFRWGWAPSGLATRAQLHAMTPKRQLSRGQDPYAVLTWWSARFGRRTANLYRIDQSRPALPETPARRRALSRAYAARFRCGNGHGVDYYVRTDLRLCGECLDAAGYWDRIE